ncbi:sigma-54-dependent transcriptional regulator [Thaumasiovibrio subtropicus]|uniref:sigma-54-dependent transcriptional regulator n=1 Tax=Thaumasiovibrio subtropicus TaxID=1891207 RepID=UPI000B34B5BB|nr:VpsR-related response regulator [Thaumasiovibrio subtropicus]
MISAQLPDVLIVKGKSVATYSESKKENARLVAIGCNYEPWLAQLEKDGWITHCCYDLRAADDMLQTMSPCICVVDLSSNDFSIQSIAQRASKSNQVRWIALLNKQQLSLSAICTFINNYCIDYFTTPIPHSQLIATIGHQLGMLAIESSVVGSGPHNERPGIIGESKSASQLRELVRRVAMTDMHVVISGEAGVGKSTVAEEVHYQSNRRGTIFHSLNANAIEKLEFTEPDNEAFSEGTVYINNIEMLSPSLQTQLLGYLQALENRDFSQNMAELRIVVSSSADMETLVQEGRFNQELYYRLNVMHIRVAALRERMLDIPQLAEQYLQEFRAEYNINATHYSEEAYKLLGQYEWPGNCRELMNQIKRAALMCEGATIDVDHFDLPDSARNKANLRSAKNDAEREALLNVLETHQGKISSAAKELGVSRATMYRLLNKHNLLAEIRNSS